MELKFRAYFKEDYCDRADNNFPSGSLIYDQDWENDWAIVRDSLYDFRELKHSCEPDLMPATLDLFTGLHDKNGKEIYENDIIDFDNREIGGHKGRAIVEYCADLTIVNSPGFIMRDISGGYWAHENFMTAKLIGNIHQSPELLERDNAIV